MKDITKCMVILTTFPSKEAAKNYLHKLLDKNCIACGQLKGPVESLYRWKGKTAVETEWQVILKTTKEKVREAFIETKVIHPYEIFQWIVIDALTSKEYAKWMEESTN